MDNKVLIIDDDIQLCQLLKKCLENENMTVEICNTGTEGLKKALQDKYHLVVLDIMLPGMNGFNLLTELRKSNTVPVLMLTAKDSEVDKVSGLRLGADDYLTKPFSINEFTARVQSLIRRYTTLNQSDSQQEEILSFDRIVIDAKKRIVTMDEKPVSLTGKEFDLLYFLVSNPGRVFTKKQIYSHVWKDEYAFDDNNIVAYMSKLRKKIEPDENKPVYIQTVWGVGYRFNSEV